MPIHLPPLSRRQFISRTLATSAGLLLGARLESAAPALDPHTWALLSDTHIHADRAKMARGINMAAQLTTVVDDVLRQSRRPAGALVNGDLSFNTGETPDYATLTQLIEPLRAARIPLHLALGNHDHRERFWAALAGDVAAQRPVVDRHVAIVRTPRANWFVLDSLDKTNSTPGLLGASQLEWLAQALDANADTPALVMVHHNPRSDPAKLTLIDEDALYAILRPRRQVKAYLFGHSHRWNLEKDRSGLHLINLPTTAYVFEPAQPIGWVLAQLEPQGLRLQLRCVDASRKDHGQTVELAYRS